MPADVGSEQLLRGEVALSNSTQGGAVRRRGPCAGLTYVVRRLVPYSFAGCLLLVGACVSATAQEESGQTRAVLGNGLTLVGAEAAGSPTVAINAFLRLSVLHERADTVGIRQLTQLWLGDRPAEGSTPSLASQIDALGARFDTATETDFVKVTVLAAAADFPAALALLKRAVFDRRFDETTFEAKRLLSLRMVAAQFELPISNAADVLRDALYANSPRGRPALGEARTLAKLTPQQVAEFHRTHYLPGLTVLSVVGGVPWSEVKAEVARVFEGVLPGPALTESVPPVTELTPRVLRRQMDTAAAAVVVGGRGPSLADADYPAAALAMSMLGSATGSRLYQALRERQSLVYSVEAEVTPSAIAGQATAMALCDESAADKVVATIRTEVDRLAATPPSADELTRSKRYVHGQYLMNRERNSDRAHYLGLLETLAPGRGLALASSLPARIEALSPAAVSRAAGQLLSRPIVVIMGPENKTGDDAAQLRAVPGGAALPAWARSGFLDAAYLSRTRSPRRRMLNAP